MDTRPLNPHDRRFRFAFADLAVVKGFVTHYLPAEIGQAVDVETLTPVVRLFELFQADDLAERLPDVRALLRELSEPKTVLEWVTAGGT